MAEETQLHRDLGRLEGRLLALEGRVADGDRRNEESFNSLQNGLDAINKKLESAALVDASRVGNLKGAWWILSALLTAAGSIGGVVTWVIKSYTQNPQP